MKQEKGDRHNGAAAFERKGKIRPQTERNRGKWAPCDHGLCLSIMGRTGAGDQRLPKQRGCRQNTQITDSSSEIGKGKRENERGQVRGSILYNPISIHSKNNKKMHNHETDA